MKSNFPLIVGILAVVTFFLFLFEIVVLMDSFIYLHFKEEG